MSAETRPFVRSRDRCALHRVRGCQRPKCVRIACTTTGFSISAMTRIDPLHFAHWRGSASYTLRISRAQAALARLATSLKTSLRPLEIFAGAAIFAARAPRLRLEYQSQYLTSCSSSVGNVFAEGRRRSAIVGHDRTYAHLCYSMTR